MKTLAMALLLGTLVVSVWAAQAAAQPPVDKVTIELNNAPIRDALRQLFYSKTHGQLTHSKTKYLVAKDVQGTVCVKLKDVDFESALWNIVDQVKADYMRVGDQYHIVLRRNYRQYPGLIAVREAAQPVERSAIDDGFADAVKFKPVRGIPFRISRAETGVVVDEPETSFRLRVQVRAQSETGELLRSWYFVGSTGLADKPGAVSFAPKESAVFIPDLPGIANNQGTVVVVDVLFGEDLGSWTHEVFTPVSLPQWQGSVVDGVVTRTR
jgi:hypothetical protein